MLKTLEC
jgi:hypothetical protein